MKTTTTFLRKLQTGGFLLALLCCGALGASGQVNTPVVKLWDKTYGGTQDDWFTSIVATSDGGYLLGGTSRSDAGFDKSEDSRGEDDYWLVKIDKEPVTYRSGASHTEVLSVSPHPNPFSGQTTFALNLTKPAKLTLEVRDLSGRLVAAETFEAPEGRSERVFDESILSAGAYFYTLRAIDGRKAEGKLIVK